MKTVRFSDVLNQAGEPDVHLLWIDPDKDKSLQKAVRECRVMTLHQFQGGKSDYAVVGFEKGVPGQVLIFPKSLKPFEGRKVIAIKYDLLRSSSTVGPEPVPPKKRAPVKNREKESGKKKADQPASGKITQFPKESQPEEKEERKIESEPGRVPDQKVFPAKISNIRRGTAWFEVLQTTDRSQIAVMALEPGRATGERTESHKNSQQILLLVEGTLIAELDGARQSLGSGDVLIIPAGMKHKFTNDGRVTALTFNVYCPPEYPANEKD
jgi:mannose-6-phosphate isomerase-like protein (cupin superfamily)